MSRADDTDTCDECGREVPVRQLRELRNATASVCAECRADYEAGDVL